MDNAIFITGSSGFIGSSLINFLTEKKTETYEIVRINKNNYKDYIKTDFKLINFYHFATHFSLNENDKLKIYEANYSYGEKLLNTLEIEKFNNFIYTNSIYSLSEKYAESSYIKSKNKFSNLIEKIKNKTNFNFIELFLDNTYGANDKRNKVLNYIIKSVNEGAEVTLQDPDSYINLIDIEKLCEFLFNLSNKTADDKNILTSMYSYKLNSILETALKINKGHKNIEVNKVPNNIKNEIKVIKINSDLEKYLKSNL